MEGHQATQFLNNCHLPHLLKIIIKKGQITVGVKLSKKSTRKASPQSTCIYIRDFKERPLLTRSDHHQLAVGATN